jgi:hypothetical protein
MNDILTQSAHSARNIDAPLTAPLRCDVSHSSSCHPWLFHCLRVFQNIYKTTTNLFKIQVGNNWVYFIWTETYTFVRIHYSIRLRHWTRRIPVRPDGSKVDWDSSAEECNENTFSTFNTCLHVAVMDALKWSNFCVNRYSSIGSKSDLAGISGGGGTLYKTRYLNDVEYLRWNTNMANIVCLENISLPYFCSSIY